MDVIEPSHKKSKPCYPEMCIVCYDNYVQYLFIIDLNYGVALDEFVKQAPIQVLGVVSSFIYVDGSTIYVIDSASRGSRREHYDHVCVYRYVLSKDELHFPGGLVLEKSMMDKAPSLGHFKRFPQAIRYGTEGILVFSTHISVDSSDIDFEIYNPDDVIKSRNLPTLRVRWCCGEYTSKNCVFIYELFDMQTRSWLPFPSRKKPASFFIVRGYTLMDTHIFVLQTNLGSTFQLNLKSPDDKGWQVYQDGWIMEHKNSFFVIGNQFCIDAFGAYDIERGDLDTKYNVWKHNCVYPLNHEEWIKEWTEEDGPYPDEEDELRCMFQSDEELPLVLKRLNKANRRVFWPRHGDRNDVLSRNGTLIGDTCFGAVEMGVEMGGVDEMTSFMVDLFKLDFSQFPQLDFTRPLLEQQLELLESRQKQEQVKPKAFLKPCETQLELFESRQHQEWAKPVKSFKFIMDYSSRKFFILNVILVEIGRQETNWT